MSSYTSDTKVRGSPRESSSHKHEKLSVDDVAPGSNDTLHRINSYAVGEQQQFPLDHATGGTKRNIKSRHAQMMAIGGAIGTSLFLGTGQALAIGGPAFLFVAYCEWHYPSPLSRFGAIHSLPMGTNNSS